jgi:hypothetical protein
MKTIARTFTTLAQAERFQNRLYNKHDTVRLIQSPMFSEDGVYVWHVSR